MIFSTISNLLIKLQSKTTQPQTQLYLKNTILKNLLATLLLYYIKQIPNSKDKSCKRLPKD